MSEQERTVVPKVRLVMRQPAQEHEQEEAGRQPAVQVQRDPLPQVGGREGDASCAAPTRPLLSRATDAQPARARGSLLRLQREYGNRFVHRVVDLSRKGHGEGDVTPEVEAAIQRERGGGQALDSGTRAQMEPAMGADFSGVRVHTGGQADTLNRDLSARAFTTGQDIFFKQGEYSPGSSSGRELLAHELTHVVQQDGDRVRRKLTVGAADDQYEQEADRDGRPDHEKHQRRPCSGRACLRRKRRKKSRCRPSWTMARCSDKRKRKRRRKKSPSRGNCRTARSIARRKRKKEEEPVQARLDEKLTHPHFGD